MRRGRGGAWTPLAILSISVAMGSLGCAEPERSSASPQLPRRAPELTLEPLFTISGNQAEFGRVVAVVANGEGRVYVADELAAEIREFDSSGNPGRTLGGRGDGPGRFGALIALGWQGDSLLALDFNPRRLTLFDSDGAVAGTVQWPEEAGRPRNLLVVGNTTYTVGLIPRSPYQAFRSAAEAEAAFRQPTLRYSALDSTGIVRPIEALADTLTEPRGFDCDSRDGQRVEIFGPLFGEAGPLRAVTPSGHLVIARRDLYRLDYVDLETGDTVRTVERAIAPHPVTEADWARATEAYREQDREFPLDCDIEGRRPEQLPVIRSISSDEAGRIWIEAHDVAGFTLAVVDSMGGMIGESPLPARDPRVPLYVRGGRIYFVARDALDVQSVHVLRADLDD